MVLVLYNSNPKQLANIITASGWCLIPLEDWEKLKADVEHWFWLTQTSTRDPLEFETIEGETIEYYNYKQWLEDYSVYDWNGNRFDDENLVLDKLGQQFFYPDVSIDEHLHEV